MTSKFFGEFMGTLILILMGNGVVANVLLKKKQSRGRGLDGDRHRMGLRGDDRRLHRDRLRQRRRSSESRGDARLRRQLRRFLQAAGLHSGAAAGRDVPARCWSGSTSFRTGQSPKIAIQAGMFRHFARHQPTSASNLFSEAHRHLRADHGGGAPSLRRRSATWAVGRPSPGFGPYLVGMLVWAIGLSLGGTTGYAINPARDLGPRIMHAILPVAGKGGSNWSYAPVPILGPMIGAALAGIFIKTVGL